MNLCPRILIGGASTDPHFLVLRSLYSPCLHDITDALREHRIKQKRHCETSETIGHKRHWIFIPLSLSLPPPPFLFFPLGETIYYAMSFAMELILEWDSPAQVKPPDGYSSTWQLDWNLMTDPEYKISTWAAPGSLILRNCGETCWLKLLSLRVLY